MVTLTPGFDPAAANRALVACVSLGDVAHLADFEVSRVVCAAEVIAIVVGSGDEVASTFDGDIGNHVHAGSLKIASHVEPDG